MLRNVLACTFLIGGAAIACSSEAPLPNDSGEPQGSEPALGTSGERASAGRFKVSVRRDAENYLRIENITRLDTPIVKDVDRPARQPLARQSGGLNLVNLSGPGSFDSTASALVTQLTVTLNGVVSELDEPQLEILWTCAAGTAPPSCGATNVTWLRTNGDTSASSPNGAGLPFYGMADMNSGKNYALRTVVAQVGSVSDRFDFVADVTYDDDVQPGDIDVDNDDDEYNGEIVDNDTNDGDPLSEAQGGDCDEFGSGSENVYPGLGGGDTCGGCNTSCTSNPDEFCCDNTCNSGNQASTCIGAKDCDYVANGGCSFTNVTCAADAFGGSPTCSLAAAGLTHTVNCEDDASCSTTHTAGTAIMNCQDTADCTSTVIGGGYHKLTCIGDSECVMACNSTSVLCDMECAGGNSTCSLFCAPGQNCGLKCNGEASPTTCDPFGPQPCTCPR